MDKKQKIRVVVIFPLVAVLLVLGGVIYFVLQAGSAQATLPENAQAEASAPADEVVAASPDMADAPSCAFDFLIGQQAEQAVEQIKPLDRPYRILAPDAMATMDFSAERINLNTDDKGIVQSVTCG